MKRTSLLWLAISSLILSASAYPATRPNYGGVLRIAISAPLNALDPADASNISGGSGIWHVAPLLFDTLTVLDNRGELQPSLALTWNSDSGSQQWKFQLRPGVKFSDGTAVTGDQVATSLREANPQWNISATEDSVIITSNAAVPQLPMELALPRNSIVHRENGKLVGTGPFTIAQWDTGKMLTLNSREDYWAGRAFVDSIDISIGRTVRDQAISLELGRVDVIETSTEATGHTAGATATSSPDELLALVFSRDARSLEEANLRQALGLAIDRNLLNNVVLQSAGAPAGGLLPNWMSGYAFLFPTALDLERARQERAENKQNTSWKLSYSLNSPVARVVAERIALNAQDAGFDIQTVTSGPSDLKLVRVRLASRDARVALSQLAAALQLPTPSFHGGPAEDLYAAEKTLLESRRVIPLLHLRTTVELGHNVRGWNEGQDGSWDLPDVWLSTEAAH
jgi:ABC-type transport system substrate-binding protein